MTHAESIAEVIRWHEDAKNFYAPWHSLVGSELSFTIDSMHYDDDQERDPQRIKPVDPSLLNLQRHKSAVILKAAAHYELRPVDDQDDPQAAADGKALLDQVMNDPESEFEDALEDVVDGSLAARVWGIEVGFDPECGLGGEVTFEATDPRHVFWTPGFKSPHSKRCPWLIIEKPMLPAEIAAKAGDGWRDVIDVPTDAAAVASAHGGSSAGPIRDTTSGGTATSETKYVTVLFCYERFVKDMKPVKTYRVVDPDDRHMWCPECGFRGMPQKTLDVTLPEHGDPCPDCACPTERVDGEAVEEEVLAYRKGRRLRIVAKCAAREFYNDRWPFDTRGFTTILYSPYNHPVNPIPNSDTYYYRSLTCVADAMLRLGYEQMRKAHGIILAPQDSLFDAYGEPFPFSEHRDVAYYDNDFLAPGAIQWFQPPGLNQAWSAYFNTIQGVFAANKGTGDLGMTPQQSKDIAVGTIRTLVETGEIPVDRHIRRFQRFKSLVLTRAYEIMRSMLTTERAVRVLGPDGAFAVRRIRASGLPGYDVVVTAEPKIAQVEIDRVNALRQVSAQPPHIRRFLARALNIPPSWLAELEAAEKQAQMQQAQMQQQSQMQLPQPNGGNRLAGMLSSPFTGAP